MRLNSNHLHPGRAGGLDADRRVFKYDAVGRVRGKQLGGAEIDVGVGLGTGDLFAIDDRLEMIAQAGAVQNQIDIGGFGIRSDSERNAARPIQKSGDPGDQVAIQLVAHHLPIKPLFRGAVLENDAGRESRGDEITHDVIVAAPMHAGFDVAGGGGDAQAVQINAPRFGVQRHRIDNHSVQVEDQRQGHGGGYTPSRSVASMQYQNLRRSIEGKIGEGQIGVVTLSRPDRRNALSLELMLELIHCLNDFAADSGVRAVILAAEGKAFSSGHDLSEMVGRTVNDYRRIFDVCTELMTRIQSIPQPVIAQVQGIATAAGCQLVATCDLAISSDQASFATPGVRIGLFCTTPMVALTRAVGRKRAMEMLLTGKLVDPATAAEWGLVNRVVPAAELEAETRLLACQIAEASSFTVGLGKQAYYAQIDLDQPKAYAYAKEVMTMNSLADDAQEGISAFLEKRVACWTGK